MGWNGTERRGAVDPHVLETFDVPRRRRRWTPLPPLPRRDRSQSQWTQLESPSGRRRSPFSSPRRLGGFSVERHSNGELVRQARTVLLHERDRRAPMADLLRLLGRRGTDAVRESSRRSLEGRRDEVERSDPRRRGYRVLHPIHPFRRWGKYPRNDFRRGEVARRGEVVVVRRTGRSFEATRGSKPSDVVVRLLPIPPTRSTAQWTSTRSELRRHERANVHRGRGVESSAQRGHCLINNWESSSARSCEDARSSSRDEERVGHNDRRVRAGGREGRARVARERRGRGRSQCELIRVGRSSFDGLDHRRSWLAPRRLADEVRSSQLLELERWNIG